MAELADALDLGSSSERSAGSIPVGRTKTVENPPQKLDQIGTMKWRVFMKTLIESRKKSYHRNWNKSKKGK